jgi:hypothetical protein
LHGKGVVDGLGGITKRSVWRHVRSDTGRATTAKEFYNIASERNPEVNIFYVAQEDITSKSEELQSQWVDCLSVPNTQKIHFVMPCGPNHIRTAETSLSTDYKEVRIKETIDSEDDEDTPLSLLIVSKSKHNRNHYSN